MTGTPRNSLTYGYGSPGNITNGYDPAGNLLVCNQGNYTTTYGYDGADQLTSETSTGGTPPPTLAYTYDSNGNRKTKTVNGAQVQAFTYDAHDKSW